MATKWVRRKIRVTDIDYGHSPDKRGERRDKWGREPIRVKPGSWGGWKVHDGNDRLYYARQRGDTHIEAYVQETTADVKTAKKRGFFYWE